MVRSRSISVPELQQANNNNKNTTFTKTSIKNNTECIGFRALITIKPDVKIILEKIKNNKSKNIFL